jgi:hypothetical protein
MRTLRVSLSSNELFLFTAATTTDKERKKEKRVSSVAQNTAPARHGAIP